MRNYRSLFRSSEMPVLLTTEQNIFYTTGFNTSARRPNQIGYTAVLIEPDECTFFLPANWADTAAEQVDTNSVKIIGYSKGHLASEIISKLKGRQAGFEREGMPLDLYLDLRQNGADLDWDVTPIMRNVRLHKDDSEIQLIRKSAGLASLTMEKAKSILRPGISEMDAVAELEYFMRKNGSSGTPFTMKVLTGEHATRTINVPGDRIIREGEIVLLDFGATLNNYASDWTRSFAMRRATDEQIRLYNLVWETERACIKAIRPGATATMLFKIAQETMAKDPFAKFFNPFLGHSIGMSSQEQPNLTPDTDFTFEPGMVFAIEPGIYVPGVGGIRIEDMVLITEEGHECLTGLKKEKFILK